MTHEQNRVYTRNLWELEQDNPYVRMLADAQTISTVAGDKAIANWSQESTIFPRQGMLPLSTGSSFLEIPFNGVWTIEAQVSWGDSTEGFRKAEIRKIAGEDSTGSLALSRIAGSSLTRQQVMATVPLNRGDRLVVYVDHSQTTPIALTTVETWVSMSGLGVSN